MFEYVTLLLSFVYALALTHLLSSTADLLLARDRVRFSGLQALWMTIALLNLLTNWISYWGLSAVKQWSVGEIAMQFTLAIIQYFTCSLVAPRPNPNGEIDMPAFFARQRPVIFGAFLALLTFALAENYIDRNHMAGLSSNAWIGEDILILPMYGPVLIGWFAKRVWLQWAGGLAFLAVSAVFLGLYAVPG
jgi:hypothetical protein